MTAWYAGLLASALLVFGASVYLGLQQYLYWNLHSTLVSECRTIGTELLPQFAAKGTPWLATEINEAYAPEVNNRFIRVVRAGIGVVYLSDPPKNGSFGPAQIPAVVGNEIESTRKIPLPGGLELMVDALQVDTPDGNRFVVESGASYHEVRIVLHGLLLILAVYTPFIVSLAGGGGYWLMRRSLQPIDEITKRAEGITSTNLNERLPAIRTGDELERLSISLNRMIARLDDAFQHINRFSADASHELRTPLTILQLELEEVIQNHRLDPALSEQIASALEETHRMSRIVENLLAISHLDAGEVKMKKVPLDLGELAKFTADEMRLLAEEKSVMLHSDVRTGIFVQGDRSRLQQVIVNLIDNAIKYTQKGGEVSVSVRRNANAGILEVFDNGAGIPAHALPHVFERFYRADKARSRASGGAGLGLSIAKAICTAHGAEITVFSQEGQGSRFRIVLPLLDLPQIDETRSTLGQL
jgi:heavy metal sensor kinase